MEPGHKAADCEYLQSPTGLALSHLVAESEFQRLWDFYPLTGR